MDVAAFKVSHSIDTDIDATTLRRQKRRARAQQPVSARVSSRGRWRKHLGRFKMQALTGCNANVMSTRTTVGQFKCQFKGAMDNSSR